MLLYRFNMRYLWLRAKMNTNMMQCAADFHEQIAHAILPQADGVFDDPAACDAADHVFDHNPAPGNRLVCGFLRIRQRRPPWFAGRTGMDDLRQDRAHTSKVITNSLPSGKEHGTSSAIALSCTLPSYVSRRNCTSPSAVARIRFLIVWRFFLPLS